MTTSTPSASPSVVARVCSYGGGLDSWAMLLDAERRGELPDAAVFIDVGDGAADRDGEDPGEWPSTYRHVREVVIPWCAARGVEFVWLSSDDYPIRDARSLFAWFETRKQIPVSGPKRICTTIAKVERFEAWLADRYGDAPVEVWIGFERGEEKRADKDPNAGSSSQRRNRFPLIESGLCRCRCLDLARASGHPVPRKSACTFCPYGSRVDWKVFARDLPEVFARVVDLEESKPPTKKNNVNTDIRVEAIRSDKVIGRGTCSSVDECMGDEEILAALDAEKIETPAAAVRWARKSERAWLDRGLDQRWGADDDEQLEMSRDFDRRCEEERGMTPMTTTKTAQERYAEMRTHECRHASRFEERVCEAEMEEARDEAAYERAHDLSREECARLLENIGIQVYEHEDIEVLRQAVVENLDDGTIEPCEILEIDEVCP